MRNRLLIGALCAVLLLGVLPVAHGQTQGQTQDPPKPVPPPTLEKPSMAQPEPDAPAKTAKPAAKPLAPAPPKTVNPDSGKTVEEIIARVNNEIITRTEYDKARNTAAEEAKSDCQNRCTPEQLQTATEDRQKNALRDLIDQSLLVQRGKDMGLSVEPEVIKRLDAIRIENKIGTMEEFEKAVAEQGLNFEDFKNNIRNGLLTQRVVSNEVGSHINISDDDVSKYYEAHKADFVRPEEVALREIEVSTEGKKPEELPDLKKKAETALKRVQDGEDFGEIAKRLSDGSTKSQGGFLGVYKRGELSKELEDKVFQMKRNELTEVMETKQGYLILQVLEHYDEGQQSLAKVKNEITDKLYTTRLEPALREYLKTLREESYVIIKPGYQDIAGGSGTEIQEVSATPEVTKNKKGRKKYLLFGKRSGANSSGD
jgi:peptidyl-prolyl cis-trans isomerase SurA